MAIERHREVERTFEVDPGTPLPPLVDEGGVVSSVQVAELALEATYVDTADLALARAGVTLRRRTGGSDAGWHLKLPRSGDSRTELHLPLGPAEGTVPEGILASVRALVRDHPLVPVVRLSTRRIEHALRDEASAVLALVCDDEVRAEQLPGADEVLEWREWEVELVAGDEPLLDELDERLRRAGAEPAGSASKLARALAGRLPPPQSKPSAKALRRGTAALAVRAHLTEHIARLHGQDGRVRSGEPGSVHKMRIATRRLRMALKTCGPLFEDDATTTLEGDLRRLGRVLSAARDAQVLRERLRDLVSTQPPELVMGPVGVLIDDELSVAEQAGRRNAVAALEDARYFRLLDDLDAFVRDLPVTDEGDRPAHRVLPGLLRRDAKRVQRAVKHVRRAEPGEAHDAALHEVRKKAKRLRYAAELAVPVLRKPATKLASAAKEVQQALGEHQDTVMSREFLREHGARSHAEGLNGFTLGRLHAIEEARAEAATKDFDRAWADLDISRVRKRLGG